MKTYLLYFLLAFSVSEGYAQQLNRQNGINDSNYVSKATVATEKMAAYLSLSKGQTQRVLKININYYKSLLEIIKPKENSISSAIKEFKDVGEKRIKSLQNVISDEQFMKYNSYLDSLSKINFSKEVMKGK